VKYRSKSRRLSCLTEALEPRRLLSAGLAVTYASSSNDESGLSTLSYNGTQLINDANSQQEFQVDQYYTLNSNGTYTAVGGENNFTHYWNAASHTLIYGYSWGTLTCQYVQVGTNRLNMVFSVNNSASSGVTLGGVDIYPAYIHFPFTITPGDEQQIVNSTNPATPEWDPEVAYGWDGPAVLPADYSDAPKDDGAVMALVNDGPATTQMYTSLWTTNYPGSTPGKDYFIFAGTAPKDTMLSDEAANPETYTTPLFYTNTAPGQSDEFEISLRFGPAGTTPTSLAPDIESNYAAAYPEDSNWPDNRPIASLHLASEGSSTSTNPNAWVLGGYDSSPINVTTTAGLNSFSAGMLNYAAGSIAQMTADHSQGMIVWDLEGEEYSQPDPSYIGDPIVATTLAPEWSYNYQNNGPIINQFFSAFTSAGFRVGMTLRPTTIEFDNGVPSQTPNGGIGSVPIAQEITNLEAKIAYAYGQWGATLFYIDSTTGFDSAALRTVQQAFPNVLLIPEHSTVSTYGTSAPYGELTNGYTGTPASVEATYPSAISVIYVADGDMTGNYSSGLIAAVAHGDIMLFRGWYADPNNTVMVSDYRAAMAVPTQTTVSATAGDSVVNLAWSAVGSHAVYNVLRSTAMNGTYVTIASGLFGTAYADTTSADYQTYYYEVVPVNGAGNGPASAAVSAMPVGPTVTKTAGANPSPVTGSTANLSVQGSDEGSGALTYTWSSSSTPANAPPVTFSVNGTNLADNTTAQFYQAGSYLLTAKITDPSGYSATSSVTVVVNQTPTTLFVLPPKLTLSGGASQQFTVSSTDQFSNTIFSPTVAWSVTNGGTISSTGLFAANQPAGTYAVSAVSGSLTASTAVTVLASGAPSIELTSVSAPNQLINIGSGDLIVPDAGTVGLTKTQSEIREGANLQGGNWNGTLGITSSAAADDTTYLTAVGVILNNNGDAVNPAPIYSTFDGQLTSLNDVLVKYTYYGDANLDGKIDGSDYTRIDNGALNHLTGWFNGDFNYDGFINGSDYTLIDNAFNLQGAALGSSTPAAEIATGKLVSKPAAFANTRITAAQAETSSNIQILDIEQDRRQILKDLFGDQQ
jgi:hypothetical protein